MDNFENPRLPKEAGPVQVIGLEPEVLRLGCYEAESGSPGALLIGRDAAVRHLFAVGASGSGKTNFLVAVIRGLLSSQKQHRTQRPGMLIYDLKGGSLPAQIQWWAHGEGRASDVVHLSLTSDFGYDFFGSLTKLEQVSAHTDKLLYVAGNVSTRDHFWDQTRRELINSALSCLFSVDGANRSFERWVYLMASWLTSEEPAAEHRELLKQFRVHADAITVGDPHRIQLLRAADMLESWSGTSWDQRTKMNVAATMHAVFGPLLESSAQKFFGVGRDKVISARSVVDEGKVLVFSVNSLLEPHLAAFAARVLKADFYEAVFARKPKRHAKHRLAALICDEYQLACTAGIGGQRFNDAVALPLLREFGAMLCAATQSIAALDAAVGAEARRVLMPNFSTVCFFRTNEREVDELAEQVMGQHVVDETAVESTAIGYAKDLFHQSKKTTRRRVYRPICPAGTLARLEPGQAYVHQHTGTPLERPIWFELQTDSPP